MNFLAVALGAMLGGIGRYSISLLIPSYWGTLTANAMGGFLIGLLLCFSGSDTFRLFAITGVLGAFTTFSTFSAESIRFIMAGQLLSALLYILASLVITLSLTALGLYLGKQFL
ncbi:fluoride efflux transporter FluC [Basilea psittacipulmonis]|uniref:Fluoride-specific ion channel FluC n=1 Tax=Basilea psittacipulmonis DSM 24701 TaxID=1072685 RepID=A0A077DF96_9BURK|nr:CrcB family protein [Basilea psittacipulmonis]AIL32791.1 hypothetical protein IX83_05220 [Basilea psittacipulmonis DSM 24701]